MEHPHNLITKYLQIIQEQEQIINALSKSNKTLLNRNNELKRQKNTYRESALEWKDKYENLKQDVAKVICETVPSYKICQAIDIYKQNQGGK